MPLFAEKPVDDERTDETGLLKRLLLFHTCISMPVVLNHWVPFVAVLLESAVES